MKKVILILCLLSGTFASANVISVEFRGCSTNPNVICANVYSDLTTGVNYGGQEMVVDEIQNETLVSSIDRMIGANGQSLALNIEGKVMKINKFAANRSYYKLEVTSFSNKGPRPRDL